MHVPQPREVVLQHNTPWEGPFSLYHTVIRDGDRYLLYYRGWRLPEEPFTHTFAPFLDDRPGVAREHRFKALARDFDGERTTRNSVLHAFVNADGIQWERLSDGPALTDGTFDSQNVSFWSQAEGK